MFLKNIFNIFNNIIETYFDNWFSIYSKFKEDSKYLNTYALVYYESFIQYPKKILLDLEYLLDVEVDTQPGTCVSRSADRDYMEAWNRQNIKKCPILNLYDYCC